MLKGIFRELKIFTMLENYRSKNLKGKEADISGNISRGTKHDGLPVLLGYRISKSAGEIMMTNDGLSLDTWEKKILKPQQRVRFMVTMLR